MQVNNLFSTNCKHWLFLSGIVVPGGFGHRGFEGIIAASKYARENKIPYLGITMCYRNK